MHKYDFSLADLVELIQYPSLLVNNKTNSIEAANHLFDDYFFISSEGVIGQKADAIIRFVKNEKKEELIIVQGSENHGNVEFPFKRFELSGLSLFCIENAIHQMPGTDNVRIALDVITALYCAQDELTVSAAFFNAIQVLVPNAITARYKQENDFPNDYRIDNEIKGFPIFIPRIEGDLIEKIDVWVSGKRVINSIQRFARDKYFSAIFTIRIAGGKDEASLIIIALNEIPDNIDTIANQLNELQKITKEKLALIQSNRQNAIDTMAEKYSLVAIKRLFEKSHLGVIKVDSDKKVISINSAACEILGFSSAEASGKSIFDLIGENLEINNAVFDAEKQGESNILQSFMHKKDGKIIPVTIWISCQNGDSYINEFWIAFSDNSIMTELQNKTIQLEQQAEMGRLMANFSHEVRNPINNIATGLQVLASRSSENQSSLDTIKRMQDDCQRVTDLFESVLSYTRPFNARMEPLILNTIINRVIEKFSLKNPHDRITFHENLDATNHVHILADSRSMEQVFTNLIANSIESFQEGMGVIGVTSSILQNNGELVFEIKIADNGPGIPHEILTKLFEPFSTSKEKGTGLGLAITKKIIKAHHGEIEVKSFPGGTIFTLSFPILDAQRGGLK